jgi:hypothetical protein
MSPSVNKCLWPPTQSNLRFCVLSCLFWLQVNPAGVLFSIPLGSIMPYKSFRKHMHTMLFTILDNAILSAQSLAISNT